MPKWLKYVLSISSGFATGAATASASGGGTKGVLIGGGLTALLSLGNLTTTAPKDHVALGVEAEPGTGAVKPRGPSGPFGPME